MGLQSNLRRTVKGKMMSPYSCGLNNPRRTSSQTFQIKDEIPLLLIIVLSQFGVLIKNNLQKNILIPERILHIYYY